MLKTKQTLPIPKGDVDFENKRQHILQQFGVKVPSDFILPPDILDSDDLDVTQIPRGYLTASELEITENYDLTALAQAIAAGKLTAVAVTSAFCKRAIIAHQLTFCLSDVYIDQALQQAKRLDEYFAESGKTVGPLHGIPISVKEMIPVAQQLCSFGMMVTRHTATEDCLLVEILRKLGAVFYVKTHQPTAVLSLECTSFLGRTLNPHNTSLSAGGSSGGEAALLAMRGSILGLGTDIGGSLRFPAMCCGVYSLKGSSGFMTGAGMLHDPFPPGLNLDGIVGLLGRSLSDIDYVHSCIQTQKPFLRDADTLPIPWTGLSAPKVRPADLKIGIMVSDGLTQTQPPISRALEWARAQLTTAGSAVSSFRPFQPERGYQTWKELLLPDGGAVYRGALSAGNEPMFPLLESILSAALAANPRVEAGSQEPASIIAERRCSRDAYRSDFLADWVAQGDPDIVIGPASFGPAPAHDTGTHLNHTSIWNVVDYPAIVVPTKFKAMGKGQYDRREYEDLEVLGDDDKRARYLWQQHSYEGAPICLQIVAKRHMENELFAALGSLREVLQLT